MRKREQCHLNTRVSVASRNGGPAGGECGEVLEDSPEISYAEPRALNRVEILFRTD